MAAAAMAAAAAANAPRRSPKFLFPRMHYCVFLGTIYMTFMKGEVRRLIRTRGGCALPQRPPRRSIRARIQADLMRRLNKRLSKVYIFSFPEATSVEERERSPQAERAGTGKAPATPSCFHLSCVMRRWGARAFCSINVPAKSGREREVSSPPNIQKGKTAQSKSFLNFKRGRFC